ncbi:hypothetical protein B857_01625 [Solibacillus isronensis B3W22]|uniref:Uncharacterized protein n=1 Tax=Solibacillus isronensis B3W22 TaxID=1224748 RepID=K1LNC1_9BACL|nr:hypothetical protein [Solibacillus isronensis]AMO86769.1 hypothetical protein SOLI23_14680 [Solibacillus silvestris]EKB45674.1 hypothetical protein B857_01625 [Solibacillus isronensis B3W22]
MGNTKFNISKEAKDIVDSLKISLDINDTPIIIKLGLAKGISLLNPSEEIQKFEGSGNWLVPENIIKERDYLLFKHLIINELNQVISDIDINKYFAFYIEKGLREIQNQIENKTSIEDIRVLILS